jgi:hypothetical protein
VMPFCRDGSLGKWLKQRSIGSLLTPDEVAPLLSQPAEG